MYVGGLFFRAQALGAPPAVPLAQCAPPRRFTPCPPAPTREPAKDAPRQA